MEIKVIDSSLKAKLQAITASILYKKLSVLITPAVFLLFKGTINAY